MIAILPSLKLPTIGIRDIQFELMIAMAGVKSWTGSSSPMAGDNPRNTINGGSSSQTTAAITTSYERERLDSSMGEKKFDSPICGDDETDDHVYTAPFDQQDQQSQANHEFDNPIYGIKT